MKKFTNYNLTAKEEQYTTERDVRELIASSLANYTGQVRFRTIESTVTTITDFTSSQHAHTGASGGGQLTDAALSSVVTVPKGGTGVNTLASGEVVIGAGAGAVTTLAIITVAKGGTGVATLTGIVKASGTSAFTAIAPLAGTKVYYVSDSSGGAVTRKLTFTDGILTAET